MNYWTIANYRNTMCARYVGVPALAGERLQSLAA
jgi:hypothetical protein